MCCMGEGKSDFQLGYLIGELKKRLPEEMMISNISRLT